MKRKKIGIITICVLLFLGAMIFIVIRNGQRKDKIRRPLWKIQKKNNMQSRMYGLKMI